MEPSRGNLSSKGKTTFSDGQGQSREEPLSPAPPAAETSSPQEPPPLPPRPGPTTRAAPSVPPLVSEFGRGQGDVVPAAGALPSPRTGSGSSIRRSLSGLSLSGMRARVSSGLHHNRQPQSPLPPGVVTDGHAMEYFTGRPMPQNSMAPRARINLNPPASTLQTTSTAPPAQSGNLNPQAGVFTPHQISGPQSSMAPSGQPVNNSDSPSHPTIYPQASTAPSGQPNNNSNSQVPPSHPGFNPRVAMALVSPPCNAEGTPFSALRDNDDFRKAIALMRGEKYDSRGPLYDTPFVEREPKEKFDQLRLHEHAPQGTAHKYEEPHYGGVPSEPVVKPDRKPMTEEDYCHRTGYILIDGKVVDPDSLDEVHGAAQAAADGVSGSQSVGPDFSSRFRFTAAQRKAPSGHIDDDNDSDFGSVDHEPIPMDGAMFQVLAKGTQKVGERSKTFVEEKTLREAADFALLGPQPPSKRLAKEDNVAVPPVNEFEDPDWLSCYSVDKNPGPKPKGEGQDLRWVPERLGLNQGRPIPGPWRFSSTTTTTTTETDEISELILPASYQDFERGRSSKMKYASSTRSQPAERYQYQNTARDVNFERGHPRRQILDPSPTKSLRRRDKHAPHLERNCSNLREQFSTRNPSRGRSRSCLGNTSSARQQSKTTQPRLQRSTKIRAPGVEQPTSVASDSSKDNMRQDGEEHSTALESDTMTKTLKEKHPAFGTAASIESNFRLAESRYNELKAIQDQTMANIDNFKSSIASSIKSLQPAERLSLKMTEMVAFRAGQAALREYRPALVKAAHLWRMELNRISTQLGGNVDALKDRHAITLQHITKMREKLRQADEMVAEADAHYYKIREELSEVEKEVLPTGIVETDAQSQNFPISSRASAHPGSLGNFGSQQHSQPGFGASFNLQSEFRAQPDAPPKHKKFSPVQFAEDACSEYSGLQGFDINQPRNYSTQSNMTQEQYEYLVSLQNDAAEQQHIRQFEAAANAPGGLFGGQPYSTMPRSSTYGGTQSNVSYQAHNQFAANPAARYNGQAGSQQPYNAPGGAHYNMASQAQFGDGQFGGNTSRQQDSQPYTEQQQYGGLGDPRQSFGYQASSGPAQFGINPAQAQQYAAQQQHGNFGRDVRGEQGARYHELDGPGPGYIDQPREFDTQSNKRYSNQMRRGDSNLSEAYVRRMSSTGEYIVQPRRASHIQPNMAQQHRNTLGRIVEEVQYGPRNGQGHRSVNPSLPSFMRSSPPPRVGQPTQRRAPTPRTRNERGQAILRRDPGTADGLIPLRLVQEHLSSPRQRIPRPAGPIQWAWQLPHDGEYRMPGYENMLTGGALWGEETNPHRSNVYRPHGSSSATRMPPPQQQMQMQQQRQMYAGYVDDGEVFHTARAYPMNGPPRTPERQMARRQGEEGGEEEMRRW